MPSDRLLGFDMPDAFCIDLYEEVHDRVRTHRQSEVVATEDKDALIVEWREFSGGYRAIAYRVRAALDHSASFTKSVRISDSPPHPQRYEQERDLFDFIVNGHSAIESLAYAVYAAASMLLPQSFPISLAIDGHVNLSTVRDKVNSPNKGFPQTPLATALSDLTEDSHYEQWARVRNILIHRSIPGRTFRETFGGTEPKAGPTTWFQGIVIDSETTTARLSWLLSRIECLLNAQNELLIDHGWERSKANGC